MKKIIYILSICMAGFLTSCDDFLTVESPDQLQTKDFWRHQSDAEQGLSAAYSQLEHSIDTWLFAEVKWPVEAYREDIVILGNDAFNYPNWVELSDFSYTNGNSQTSLYWQSNYRGINFANQVIERVAEIPDENIDPTIRTQIVSEAHFLRAYYHMKLILNFEQIIVRDEYVATQEQTHKALSSREEAWQFIVGELGLATALPPSHSINNIGRATSGAAYAYLGFAYLTRAYEESGKKDAHLSEALKALEKVTNYELVDNFASMFDASNKNSKESIFELQFSMNSASGANYYTQAHRWIGSSELAGWDEILPSQFLMDEYMKEGEIATTGRYDSRLYNTIFYRCDYFNDPDAGRVYGYTYDDLFDDPRPAFRKFLPGTLDGLLENYCAVNIPLMRYANVLLMKAEVHNEMGNTSLAIPLINEVRDVHGDMPAMTGNTYEAVKAQIEHERIIEFPLENFRWYDLRRWGKLPAAMQAAGRTGFSVEKHAFYPVPLKEINSNDLLN
ncbi:RagB/SusD family nutrient uptake outer membrane protein [Bacteroides sp. 51]|uniref:RagB/SusD family nutrient uptake outer membrane protein n=1 Tax=Bacteroides sp. 51 TaxID=2302938 RepID=UPI0013D6EE25|nr:RagB/SusD family nutrient uptake outer membrane protein [Bacteroides sp. 51]NDV82180.1 RagB/SusD family nutrient uptake outer membrane protein [Bacteroides sp. 51]